MILNQEFSLKRPPPIWFWVLVFVISLLGMSYIGLNPEIIETNWPWVLATYNILMCLVAIYYIILNTRILKQQSQSNVIGSKFTWSFIKIVPILTLVPVLSFYVFSFQSIQDNLTRIMTSFDNFNEKLVGGVDEIQGNIEDVLLQNYFKHSTDLMELINSFSTFKKGDAEYVPQMQAVLDKLIKDGWACHLSLFDKNYELIAKTAETETCRLWNEEPLPANQTIILFEDPKRSLVQVDLSTRSITRTPDKEYLILSGVYPSNKTLSKLLASMNNFRSQYTNINVSYSTSIIRNRFLMDFSTTVLLTILSVLLIVFRMMDHLMKPLHNLSLATREISRGNYDVLVHNQEENKDMQELIGQFNEMSKQIKQSRVGLDTHNLYLETVLKYSYGVIGLDRSKKIQLINTIISDMLMIKDEKAFIGQLCEKITQEYDYLQPLFTLTKQKFDEQSKEWSDEVKLSLPNRQVLLSVQGAPLDTDEQTLGYVIIIKDISQLHRAQKKAAWGEVAVRMAHEIKNPLTPILLSAQRLRSKFLEKLDGKDLSVMDKTTNTIIDQVKSMDSMVSAFADYANMPQVDRKACDLNALINQAISLYDAQKNVDIELDLSGNVPELLLDANSISRVLINLVKNASEATDEDKSLCISISTHYLEKDAVVQMIVADDGDGFDPEVIDKVFDPYVTTKLKGSGLGLAIVQSIVEQHDGRIYATNAKPHGAIITIEFDYKKELGEINE